MRTHNLKLNVEYFDDVKYEVKKFEVRKNDRGYCLGDILILQEWDGVKYTGREVTRVVSYIIDLQKIGLEGWVAMGIE